MCKYQLFFKCDTWTRIKKITDEKWRCTFTVLYKTPAQRDDFHSFANIMALVSLVASPPLHSIVIEWNAFPLYTIVSK